MVKAYSNPEEDEENNQEAEGRPTTVQWALPSNPDDFHTYINHGCTLDSRNYPIYPNGQTIFVKTPNMDIKNFATWVALPPTAPGSVDKLLARKPKCKGAAGRCPGTVSWQACSETGCRFDINQDTGWGLMRHRGTHNHPWPESKKPHELAQEEL
ncbi:hypothetical protein PCASD_06984 [Puccinia coronata f. sp. avenae]|uniref:Uncharacterized protein n=1 Tax=Puccinia coronata f. sp. avenae TaxID=200324 RepID=A0A2N5UZS9_9BASI|nr:hypothetical protein PCASD_06984 [Puccinia coronata f. sp. avenae]